jgi:hypothetical protein
MMPLSDRIDLAQLPVIVTIPPSGSKPFSRPYVTEPWPYYKGRLHIMCDQKAWPMLM